MRLVLCCRHSAPARVTLVRSCQTLSYVSEGAIFIYVGMDTLDPLKWKVGPRPAAPATLPPFQEACYQAPASYSRARNIRRLLAAQHEITLRGDKMSFRLSARTCMHRALLTASCGGA